MKAQLEARFYLGEKAKVVSTNPIHGDLMTNVAVTQQLVATLVSYSADGLFVPSAASSWNVSDQGKVFTFVIKPNLRDQTGTALDASYFAKGLHKLFRLHLNKGDLPDFNLLVGWEAFTSRRSQNVSGVEVVSPLEVRFTFVRKPITFLKYISLPKFGFVSLEDFRGEDWRDDNGIISTGAFAIDRVDLIQKQMILKKNKFFGGEFVPRSPEIVYVCACSPPSDEQPYEASISMFRNLDDVVTHSQGNLILGPPIVLTYLAVSPYLRPFDSVENRRSLRENIIGNHKINWQKGAIGPARFSARFYPSNIEVDLAPRANELSLSGSSVKIVISNQMGEEERAYISSLIVNSLPGAKVEISVEDRSKPGWLEEIQEYKQFHIRASSVSTGAQYINWAVKMMFCGKLGVGLPDPSGSVCKLVQMVDDQKVDESSAVFELEKIVEKDASVIPLYYYGISWLISNDIRLTNSSQLNYYPYFNEVQIGSNY